MTQLYFSGKDSPLKNDKFLDFFKKGIKPAIKFKSKTEIEAYLHLHQQPPNPPLHTATIIAK